MKTLAFISLICLSLAGCSAIDVYERTAVINKQQWFHSDKPSFTFIIPDTTSLYNIFIVIRHTDAYKYNNLWLQLDIQFPGDTLRTQKLDVTLGTDAEGWEGRGMDDIFEYRKIITPGPIALTKSGKYTFTLSQIMREDPLEHVMNVGVRVERVK